MKCFVGQSYFACTLPLTIYYDLCPLSRKPYVVKLSQSRHSKVDAFKLMNAKFDIYFQPHMVTNKQRFYVFFCYYKRVHHKG